VLGLGLGLGLVLLMNPPILKRDKTDESGSHLNSSDENVKSKLLTKSESNDTKMHYANADERNRTTINQITYNALSSNPIDINFMPEASTDDAMTSMTMRDRIRNTLKLWPFMIPLFVVYFSEYAMQAGVWSAIGFPIDSQAARNQFYAYGNWMYQAGVFVSRSSGMLLKADMRALWVMPILQFLLLIFFLVDAYLMWWYNWALLSLCFLAGLLGGAVYVGGFSLMSEQVAPSLKEVSCISYYVECADLLNKYKYLL
jgi:hypothetical protein